MSATDDALRANQVYSLTFSHKHLSRSPQRKLAILSCMDARIDVEVALGLRPGDANILRNAGALVTEDILRSLILSHHLLGMEEVMIVAHTGCGMLSFKDQDLMARLRNMTGVAVVSPQSFGAFQDLEESVRDQVQKVRNHPWLASLTSVRGFIYDVETGRLSEVGERSPTLSYDLPPLSTALEEIS
jgi:carbonic anhydrase